MTITLQLTLQRPADRVGQICNINVLDDLLWFDGVCIPLQIDLSEPQTVTCTLLFRKECAAGDEPMLDAQEAEEWACNELWTVYDWAVTAGSVVHFEPDEDDGGAAEAKAQSQLGDRPFRG